MAITVTGNYAGSFVGDRQKRFDPLLIIAQIVLLQACFYTSFLVLLAILDRATGTDATIGQQVFNHTFVTLRHFPGWVTCTALLLSAAGPTALAFVGIVGRAKRTIDFACTLLISHIIATTINSGFPTNVTWWFMNILATCSMAAVGEAISLKLELKEITVDDRLDKKRGFDLESGDYQKGDDSEHGGLIRAQAT